MGVRVFGVSVLVLVFLCSSFVLGGTVSDPGDCVVQSPPCSVGKYVAGFVSGDGHYHSVDNAYINFPYRLCCGNADNFNRGDVTFYYTPISPSSYNGSGHVYFNTSGSVTGLLPMRLGFLEGKCSLKSSCVGNEICVFKVNSPDLLSAESSHVADCNAPNFPFTNSFNARLCCSLTEICNDGIDNDGDGFVDCGDEDCKLVGSPEQPAFCQGSNQTSDNCILNEDPLLYNPFCAAEPPYFDVLRPHYGYCSFGAGGSPVNQGSVGVCCQVGTYASQNPIDGIWYCEESAPCGTGSSEACNYDFDLNTNDWINSYFQGDINNWCVNRLPFPFQCKSSLLW